MHSKVPLSYKVPVIVAVALALGGYWYFGRDAELPDDVRFQTQAISIGRIESIVNAAGTISPVVTVDVGSELSGLVSELNADFNSEVKTGQVLRGSTTDR
jgi:HlyD family secretion protein